MEVTKKQPKGKAVETEVAAAYKSLGNEVKAKYPDKFNAKPQSYGSKGDAFGG